MDDILLQSNYRSGILAFLCMCEEPKPVVITIKREQTETIEPVCPRCGDAMTLPVGQGGLKKIVTWMHSSLPGRG